MPRMARLALGDTVYHVINRSNGRVPIFTNDKQYQHFESLLEEAKELIGMRILAYCIMPNHWHLVLYPALDTDLPECMRWLTTTHVRQYRSLTKSIGHGHLYQGRYKSFPTESDHYLTTLIRYVEQNPLRATLVRRAEDWRWSSLYRRERGTPKARKLLAPLPTELPANYLDSVNDILAEDLIAELRQSVNKEMPFGPKQWVDNLVQAHGLGATVRGAGRPRKIY